MNRMEKKGIETLKKLKEKYPNYDFSNSSYKGAKSPISFFCKKHGIVSQRPNDMLNGHGCKFCGNENKNKNRKHKSAGFYFGGRKPLITKEKFLEVCSENHEEKYTYFNLEEIKKQEETSKEEETVTTNTKPEETKPEIPSFTKPVEGEIIKEFAKNNLVYSDTLGEWITHYGIDIKADKTTVVKSSAAGTVKYIKNDPRYGLTIVIEHTSGYKTVYANLLSTEFVVVGENVEQGQTIGTVGTTSTFEVLDDPHLHFEIIKDDEYLDPQLMLN